MSHERINALLQVLQACADECNNCAAACFAEKDVQLLVRCIKLTTDCADFCRVTASFIARQSEYAKYLRNECAQICTACADECDTHGHLKHCRKCSEICKKCADACWQRMQVN